VFGELSEEFETDEDDLDLSFDLNLALLNKETGRFLAELFSFSFSLSSFGFSVLLLGDVLTS
jgi:hypothetical protein